MEHVEVKASVAKEMHECMEAVKAVVLASKQALADGWQPAQDVPAIVMAAVSAMLPAVQGLDKVAAEMKEDPAAVVKAVSLAGADIVSAFLKK